MTTDPKENVSLPADDVLPQSVDDEENTGDGTTGGAKNPFLNQDVTEEDIRQLERERAERLDPANRPANAEVDNTGREWVSEKEDFRDNLEGNPPAWDKSDGAGTVRNPDILPKVE